MARRYEFYVRVPRTISHSFAALTREILFLPLEHKIHIFSPLCNILYIFDRIVCVLVTLYKWGHFVMLIIGNSNRISVQSWTYLNSLRHGNKPQNPQTNYCVQFSFLSHSLAFTLLYNNIPYCTFFCCSRLSEGLITIVAFTACNKYFDFFTLTVNLFSLRLTEMLDSLIHTVSKSGKIIWVL